MSPSQDGPPRLGGTGIWSGALRFSEAGAISDAAAELDELGYTALWIPDVGGEVFEALEILLRATRRATAATGVLNLWMHSAEETAAGYAGLTESYGPRVLIGIGVSHAPIVEPKFPGRYQRPLEVTARYLDDLDAASPPLPRDGRVLAALGPKMLELARDRAAGSHPYNGTPEHTARVRLALGSEALVLPEQAVALVTDVDAARQLGRQYVQGYLSLPNYTNNLRRLGFGDDDFVDGGSDRLVDALVAWGDEAAIRGRVDEHRAAGADHVCIQVLSDEKPLPLNAWRRLAPALTT
jgi:probable F420-dependent oxidoreductase